MFTRGSVYITGFFKKAFMTETWEGGGVCLIKNTDNNKNNNNFPKTDKYFTFF